MKHTISILLITLSAAIFSGAALANDHGGKGEKKGKANKMFEKVDVNQDGQLELSEFLANAEARFKAMDLNQDGYVTKDEGQQAHKAMREKRKAKRKQRRGERQAENENTGPA